MTKLFRLCAIALAMVILLAPAGFAQTTINTGALSGKVTDGSGSPLPGVTVTVTSPRLQGSRTAVTDGQGDYSIPLLPPGTYKASYELSGVQTQNRDGIVVSAGVTSRADVAMQMALSETVTVTASQVVVDTTQTQQQTNLKEEHLKYTSVSSANRSFQQAIAQVPEAVGGGNANVAGANINSNTFMIDGINALTDPVTHTFASNMVFDAIQEMNIIAFGKDAEYRSSGGTINVITKSGGNEFSGSFDYRYSDPDFFTETGKKYGGTPTYFGGPEGTPRLRFDKSTITDKSKQPQATLGGPIMRDKLWFFASAHRPETSRIAPNVFGFQPGSRDFTGWNTLAKVTYTPFSNHTFAGRYTNSFATITNILFSSSAPVEADGYQTQHNKNLSADYNGVLSSRWLVSAQIGHTPASLAVTPMSNDLSKVRFSDLDTGIVRGNYNNAQGRESYRDELLLSSTYYLEAFGSHAIKGGIYFDKNGFDSYNFTTGDPANVPGLPADACAVSARGVTGLTCGVTYTVRGGVPVTATVTVRNPVKSADAKGRSLYLQDQWNPIAPLTIRAGLRYDNVDWESEKVVPTFKLLQPRFGIAYDLFNNGGTVIHAYGGKIIDENQVTLPNNLNIRYAGSATWTYSAANQAFAFTRTTVNPSGLSVDPNLTVPYSNEYSLGFTQRLFRNTSIDVTAEKRTGHNLFGVYQGDANVPSSLTAGTFTACPHDECGVFRSQFEGIVTKIDSRPTSKSSVSVSWTHSKSKGSTAGDNASGQNVSGSYNYYPFNFTNYFGFQADDAADRVKVNGYYQFPWQITLGGSFNWDSGTPWNVTKANAAGFGTEFLEPRGSRRFPHFHQLDLQLQKDFTVGPVKAGLIASVINVMNKELPTGINGNAGSRAIAKDGKLFIDPDQVAGANRLAPTFGRYTSFQRPRRYEAGIRFEF